MNNILFSAYEFEVWLESKGYQNDYKSHGPRTTLRELERLNPYAGLKLRASVAEFLREYRKPQPPAPAA